MDKLLLLFACISIGQYSSGFLTRRPTNTVDVAGSSNITFECASSYGTNATRWYFSPFDSSSNQTIQISNGYTILATNQQQYLLLATTFSSILIVRQLSNLTEGNYSCHDYIFRGSDSAWALLLIIPLPIIIEPLFGPIAGGTNITMAASATWDYLSKIIGLYIPYSTGVQDVYIGQDLTATSVSIQLINSSTVQLVAVTPSTTVESIEHPLPIVIGFLPTPFNISINKAFTYKPNPEITGIYPNEFIVTGGLMVDLTGQSLSSVARPIIQLTVVISREAESSLTSNTSTEACTVRPGNDTHMQCPMPPLNLPDDFLQMLNPRSKIGERRRRRNMKPRNRLIAKSQSLLSRMKRDANVLTLFGSNGKDRADIYLGFILDGQKRYENINNALPNTKILFYADPEIEPSDELMEFDPDEDELIYLMGKHMSRGCRLSDYVVHIGNDICNNSDLQDNQLSCRPPKVEPSLSAALNDTINCQRHHRIRITLGYKQYQYACMEYTVRSSTTRRVALIAGLTVGLVGGAIILAIVIVCIVRYHRKTNISRSTRIPEVSMV